MYSEELREKFEEVYESKIKPNAAALERKRLEALKKYKILFTSSISTFLCALACWGLGALTRSMIFALIFVLLVIIMVPLFISTNRTKDNFRKEAKSVLLKHLLSVFGMFYIAKDSPLALKDIKDFGFFHRSSRKLDDDNIVGEYKGNPVILNETELYHTEKSGKTTRHVTDFKGLILTVKFARKFEGTSVLIKKDNLSDILNNFNMMFGDDNTQKNISNIKNNPIFKFFNQIYSFQTNTRSAISNSITVKVYNYFTHKKEGKTLERVSLEDVEFSKKYDIFSDSQVESRYILNPSFMEKIRDLEMKFITICEGIVFDENIMYLFLDQYMAKNTLNNLKSKTRDKNESAGVQFGDDTGNGLFEVTDINKTLNSKENFEKVFFELAEIFGFIDYINDEK